MSRLKGLFVLDPGSCNLIYGQQEADDINRHVDIIAPVQSKEAIRKNPALLKDVDVIFSGWGAPLMDASFLAAAPNLKAVFYGAGSIRYFVTEDFWKRGITVTSAYAANAVPVSEYTLSVILLSLKQFWSFAAGTRRGEGWQDRRRPIPGNFRRTVGLVSMGMIARRVVKLLKPFDLDIIAYCPFMTAEEAHTLGVTRCSLETAFQNADVVSLHTPDLPETRGMITGALFESMKPGATFINTARGRVVAEQQMIEVLQQRTDLTAVLDVTYPEPPAADSPLLTLPNVVLTPHIAGSLGQECQRMGQFMVEELNRYVEGAPLKWQITQDLASRMA